MRLAIGLDLCFWGLPVCLRWQFNEGLQPSYIVLHFLCLEIIVEWF